MRKRPIGGQEVSSSTFWAGFVTAATVQAEVFYISNRGTREPRAAAPPSEWLEPLTSHSEDADARSRCVRNCQITSCWSDGIFRVRVVKPVTLLDDVIRNDRLAEAAENKGEQCRTVRFPVRATAEYAYWARRGFRWR